MSRYRHRACRLPRFDQSGQQPASRSAPANEEWRWNLPRCSCSSARPGGIVHVTPAPSRPGMFGTETPSRRFRNMPWRWLTVSGQRWKPAILPPSTLSSPASASPCPMVVQKALCGVHECSNGTVECTGVRQPLPRSRRRLKPTAQSALRPGVRRPAGG